MVLMALLVSQAALHILHLHPTLESGQMEVVLVLLAVFHTFDLDYTKGASAILIFIDKYAFGFNDQKRSH